MPRSTNISWATHTASPHLGCSKVDPCCTNCYAELLTLRNLGKMMREAYHKAGYPDWQTMPVWGDKSPRVLTRGFWKDADGWNRNAVKNPGKERPRMFTSMDDWLDEMPAGVVDQDGNRLTRIDVIGRFVHKMWECQNLDWLTLTKRPQLWRPTMLEVLQHYSKAQPVDTEFCFWLERWLMGHPPRNVWFGYTAGTRKEWVDRALIARDIPAAVMWCSAEPLLEQLFWSDIVSDDDVPGSHPLDWIVIGGESGNIRREIPVEWICSLAEGAINCRCIPYVKQDTGLMPGNQGRIPDAIWRLKGYPTPK